MGDDRWRRGHVKATDAVLDRAVSHGHTLVLAQMLAPGLDEDRFDVLPGLYHTAATFCIHVPMLEPSAGSQRARKTRCRSGPHADVDSAVAAAPRGVVPRTGTVPMR